MQKDTPVWQNLQAVLKSTHRAKDLVGQILAFSRQNELDLLRPLSFFNMIRIALIW
jgi:hypothetical protein